MDVEASIASENWAELISEIHERCRYGAIHVELDDSEADRYDFANEILMRRMQESLVQTLQRTTQRVPFSYLTIGNKFFLTMNEQQQQSFFGGIFNLPVMSIDVEAATDNNTESPAVTISISALLETLPQLHTSVETLSVSNFELTRQSDVQAMANIIVAKCATLNSLSLTSIKCHVDDCNKQDIDKSYEFLDPLFYAASGLNSFCVAAKTRSVHSTLVSPRALRALFVEGKQFRRLCLNGLGLTDSHVLVIVDGLSTPGTHLGHLDLESNPGISAEGYDALFNLINGANVVGYVIPMISEWTGFCVDDKAWEGKLNLVSEMNSRYRRLEYLTNGSFSSEERRWQWLERLARLPSSSSDDEEDDEDISNSSSDDEDNEEEKQKRDTKHLNFIWYTLCQNPEMMRT